jgi:hypothetical protein
MPIMVRITRKVGLDSIRALASSIGSRVSLTKALDGTVPVFLRLRRADQYIAARYVLAPRVMVAWRKIRRSRLGITRQLDRKHVKRTDRANLPAARPETSVAP